MVVYDSFEICFIVPEIIAYYPLDSIEIFRVHLIHNSVDSIANSFLEWLFPV